MDKFPERRPEIKSLNNTVDVGPVMDIISDVVQFLMTKATHENRKQDKYNQTYLGGVSFYFSYNDITKETRLMFDKHPKTWNVKEILGEMLNMEADIMMDRQASHDAYDNPFTF
jgi:hypothetical protein